MVSIPFINLKAQHAVISAEINDRFKDIFDNTAFILGKHVEEFENQLSRLHDARYCIGVSSGTAALQIALMAAGIGHGHKVLLPVNTFIATAEAVSMAGAVPVFVDCDPYFNIDFAGVARALEDDPSIKAVIPVHLYGQPANMPDITRLGNTYAASTFRFLETYNVVAFLYLTMTIALALGVRYFERRMSSSEKK